MRTTAFYINRKNLDSKFSTDVVRPICKGRYGNYSKGIYGGNYSEKKTLEDGFEIENLTASEIDELRNQVKAKKDRIAADEFESKLKQREAQVNICLSSNPLPIEENTGENPFVAFVVNLSNTPMIEAYHGCGKGTAYLNDNNELIAFHYGYDKPVNAPKVKEIQVDFSGTQICF